MTNSDAYPTSTSEIKKPTISILGAYRVDPTNDLFDRAMKLKYGGVMLTNDEREQIEQQVHDELASVVLFEVVVENPDHGFDVGDFRQLDSDQVAYDEAFLSSDGETVVSRLTAPESDFLRIAFYLHYVNLDEPLATSYGELLVPRLEPMPDRLCSMVPYEPVG